MAKPASPLLQPKRQFTFAQAHEVAVKAARSFPDLVRCERRMGGHFMERIMLAVTEVNGCPACAYVHAKTALRTGMNAGEIRQMLSGDYDGAPDRELPALMFAQHYADSHGTPDQAAWAAVEKEYGPNLARGILGAVRAMMWGNVMGLAASGLQARISRNPLKGSSTPRDIAMVVFGVLDLPVAIVQAALSSLFRRPLLGNAELAAG